MGLLFINLRNRLLVLELVEVEQLVPLQVLPQVLQEQQFVEQHKLVPQ
jgi:hypothetical protein